MGTESMSKRRLYKILGLMCVTSLFFVSGCTKEDAQSALSRLPFDEQIQTVIEPKDAATFGEKVTVERVVDGDTIVVTGGNGEETVRLSSIDTPETVHPDKPEQLFGREASDFAKSYLTEGLEVILERSRQETDKYGRTLGYIWVGDVNFNELMVETGYARVAYMDSGDKYAGDLQHAQEMAKHERSNIWSIDGYVTDKGFN